MPTSPDYTVQTMYGKSLMVRSLKTASAVSTAKHWTNLVHECQTSVRKLQRRIYRESQKGNLRKAHFLQRLLSISYSTKVIAVNRVTSSGGKLTPGIDGKIYISVKDKKSLVDDLNLKKYKPLPTRRVQIPKPQGGKRLLGIPTIRDRAHQALVLLAIEPEWEARFEPNSFGFRPGRGAHNAIKAISDLLHYNIKQYGTNDLAPKYKAKHIWVLDADITKCFDTIDHKKLLQKIGRSSPFYETIRKWLQVGTITEIGFKKTKSGTPQGGVISPLLANIALHGIEELFGIYTEKTKNLPPIMRKYISPSMRRGYNRGISLIRYADDLVVIANDSSKRFINSYVIPKLNKFLNSIGLSLNKAKTNQVNIKRGFTFLGFRFRFRGDMNHTTYWPDKERIDRSLKKLRDYVMHRATIPLGNILNFIQSINRRIQGIIRYFGWSRAYGTMCYLSHRVWWIMFRWGLRRHRKRGKKWVRRHWFSHRPWETFTYNNQKVTVPYLFWRQMVKARGGWWEINQIKTTSSVYA